MAKADLTRDYYADLGILATATETEIKKQFRLLALKYHPDRNPGRESEVNSKFQTIQSAVEVLTDPEQRAKYDSGRARAGRGVGGSAFASQARPASGFARGNPYANAGAEFPPPPRREARPKSQAPPPSAGASRYASNFGARPGGYPSAPKPAPPENDAESRRKTYEAWNRMRGEGRQPEPSAYEKTRPPPPPPPQQKSAPPPIPKRSGYAPNSAHDEPPAANTSAYSTQRHRAPTAKQDSYAEPPPRKQAPADPFKTFREKTGTPLEPRLSTPYAGRGNGEKTNPFESVNLGRSNTTRADSGSFGRSSRERHRSVSPSRAARHPNIPTDFSESNRAGSETNINGSPKRTFSKTSRPSNLATQPRSTPVIDITSSSDESEEEAHRAQRKYAKVKTRRTQDTFTPSKPTTGPQPSYATPNPAAQGTSATLNGDPKMYDLPKPATRLHYLRTRASNLYKPIPSPARAIPTTRSGVLLHNASALNTPSGDSSLKWKARLPSELDFSSLSSPITPEAFSSSPATLTPFESFQGTILDKLVEKNSDLNLKPRSKGILKEYTTSIKEPKEAQDPWLLMSPPPWMSELDSTDKIMIMTPAYIVRKPAAAVAAKLNQKDYPLQNFVSWPALTKYLKELAADMPTFRFSFKVEGQTYTAHSNPTRYSTAFTPQGTEKINTTFTPEDWHGKFEAGDYFAGTGNPPTPSRASSSSSGAKRAPPKAHASSSANPYPIIDTEIPNQSKSGETAPSPGGPRFTPDEWAETLKAPIFAAPPTPAPPRGYSRSGTTRRQKTAAASGKASKPRTAAVESDDDSDHIFMGSRPVSKNGKKGTFTDGDMAGSPNAMDIDPPATGGARNVNVEPSRPEWRTGQPSGLGFQSPDESPPQSAPPQPQFDGQAELEDLKTNFNDFKKTEPFMTPAKGLSSFADLKTDLPFQSKASSAVPFPKTFDSKELILPPPPKGPKAPITSSATRPSSEVFNAYLSKMAAYMAEWIRFESQMVGHFQVRNEAVKMVSRTKSDWLGTLGDAHLDEYLENVRQDERVREWWATAVDKHKETMEVFKWVKGIFRDGAQEARPQGLYGEVVDGVRA